MMDGNCEHPPAPAHQPRESGGAGEPGRLDMPDTSEQALQQVRELLSHNRLSIATAAESIGGSPGDLGHSGEDRDLVFRSTGWSQLDAILPERGLRPGMLLECLGQVQGGGVALLGLWLARQMLCGSQKGVLVVFDHDGKFYPPAAAALGISLKQLMIVTPQSRKDLYWALDQVLRCPAVSAVWGCLSKVNSRDFRRLQLAAEAGRALGVLVREDKFAKSPTWAHVRLQVSALAAKSKNGGSDSLLVESAIQTGSDWCFRIERKRAVAAMLGKVLGQSECQVDFKEVMETSGVGRMVLPPRNSDSVGMPEFGQRLETAGPSEQW